MCVKFEYVNSEIKDFSPEIGLETQLKNVKAIDIDYKGSVNNLEVEALISQLNKILKFCVLKPFDVKFDSHDFISGAKLAREIKKIEKKNKKAYLLSQTLNMHTSLVKELDSIIEDIQNIK